MKRFSHSLFFLSFCIAVLAFCMPAYAAEVIRYVSDNAELKAAVEEANNMAAAAALNNTEMDWMNIIVTKDIGLKANFLPLYGDDPMTGIKLAKGVKIRMSGADNQQYTIYCDDYKIFPFIDFDVYCSLELSDLIFDGRENPNNTVFAMGGGAANLSLKSNVIVENFYLKCPLMMFANTRGISDGSDIVINNSIVRNNSGPGMKMGFIVQNSSNGSVTVNDSVFENNVTDTCMGGVFNTRGVLKIDNSRFEGNVADSGSAVYAVATDVTITNSTFKNNRARDDSHAVGGNGGGALQLQRGTVATIKNCEFIGNTTDCAGGGLLVYVETDVTLENCSFIDNEADAHGGAITVAGMFSQDEEKGSTIYLNNCLLEGNVAHGTEDQVDQVNAPDSPGGGAIFLHEYCKAYLNDGTIIRNNESKYCGGAAFVAFGGELICDGAEIYDNKAALDGGAVYVDGTGAYAGFDHSDNTVPAPDNSFAAGGTLTMKDGIITNNTAGRNGGGVYINGENEVIVDGEQYIYTGGKTYMTGGIITENTAKDMGGGVYVGACDTGEKGGVLQMVDGAICDNIAGENGNSSTGENDAGADVYSEGGNAYITLIGADAVTAYILDTENTHVPAVYRRMRFTNWYNDYSDQDPTYGKSAEKIGTGTNTGRYETSIDPDRIVYAPTEKDNAYNALILDKEVIPEVPATGDRASLAWYALMAFAGASLLLFFKKKIYQ